MRPATDHRELRDAFGCFPSGVTALCAMVGGVPVGMAASSFTSVSLAPPLVSICVQTSSETWRKLNGVTRLGVSVLSVGHDAACRQLASKTGDRFAGIEWTASESGAVFINGSAVWLECLLDQCIPAGDHDIALLQIEKLHVEPNVEPLVFHGSRFRQLVGV